MKFIYSIVIVLFTLCFRSNVSFLFNIQRDLLSAIEVPTVYKMIIVDDNPPNTISKNETAVKVTKYELPNKHKHRYKYKTNTKKKDIANKVKQIEERLGNIEEVIRSMKDEMERRREEKEIENVRKMNVSEYKDNSYNVSISVNNNSNMSTSGVEKEKKEVKKCGQKEQNDKVSNNIEITMLEDVLDEELGFLRARNNTEEKQ